MWKNFSNSKKFQKFSAIVEQISKWVYWLSVVFVLMALFVILLEAYEALFREGSDSGPLFKGKSIEGFGWPYVSKENYLSSAIAIYIIFSVPIIITLLFIKKYFDRCLVCCSLFTSLGILNLYLHRNITEFLAEFILKFIWR